MKLLEELADKGALSKLPLEVMEKSIATLDMIDETGYKHRLTDLALNTYEGEDVTQSVFDILESELTSVLMTLGIELSEPSLTLLVDVLISIDSLSTLDEDILDGLKADVSGADSDMEILNITLSPLMVSTSSDFEFLVSNVSDSLINLIRSMLDRREYNDIKTIVNMNKVLSWIVKRLQISENELPNVEDKIDLYFDLPLNKILEMYKGTLGVVDIVTLVLASKDGRVSPEMTLRKESEHLEENYSKEISASMLIVGEYNENK